MKTALDILKNKNIKIVKWESDCKFYPNYMYLAGDKGILAYIIFNEFKSISKMKYKLSDIIKIIAFAYSRLDRPIFFVNSIESENRIIFETDEQIRDRLYNNKGFVKYYYPDESLMGDLDELIDILKQMKNNQYK